MRANYLMKLLNRVKAILLTPQAEWKVIERERDTLGDLLIKYVAILAAIPEVAHFIGSRWSPAPRWSCQISCARSSSTPSPSPWSTSSRG